MLIVRFLLVFVAGLASTGGTNFEGSAASFIERLKVRETADGTTMSSDLHSLPNVKDEPRRELARRVPHSEMDSDSSFRSSFGRTRRDSSRRWLWRLVGRFHFFSSEKT